MSSYISVVDCSLDEARAAFPDMDIRGDLIDIINNADPKQLHKLKYNYVLKRAGFMNHVVEND